MDASCEQAERAVRELGAGTINLPKPKERTFSQVT